MDIWLIQLGEPIPIKTGVRKQRITLLAEALLKRGHRVTRWGSAFDHITKTMISSEDTDIQLAPNYHLKLIKGLGYEKNISFRRYLDHALIDKKLVCIAKTMPAPDLILVATPPHGLAYKVVRFAREHNIPVIVDIRDQWPDLFVQRMPSKLQKLGRCLFAWEYFKIRHALAEANAITAMMEELLQWGLSQACKKRTSLDKVFHIGTKLAEYCDTSVLRADIKKLIHNLNGKKIFTFVGTFSSSSKPDIIIDAANIFDRKGRKDIIFLLAGSGDYFNEIKHKARELRNVHLLGWLNHEEIMAILKVTDVGICPLNEHRPCFPNKIFIYLSAFLPVIASTPGDFERLMQTYNIGLYYNPGDIEGFYQAIISLADNTQLRTSMRDNISKIFGELFDADVIYGRFADHIEYMVNNYVNQRIIT